MTAPAGVSAAFRYTFKRPTLTCRRASHCKLEFCHGYQYLSLYNGSEEGGQGGQRTLDDVEIAERDKSGLGVQLVGLTFQHIVMYSS